MPWHVYMLLLRNGMMYVGQTNDLERRLNEHATARGSKATTDSPPLKLIYTEPHPDRISAMGREGQLKRWSRAKQLALAAGHVKELHRSSANR